MPKPVVVAIIGPFTARWSWQRWPGLRVVQVETL